MSDPNVKLQLRESVQTFPDAKKNPAAGSFWIMDSVRGEILPAWGTRERERVLRLFYRHEDNWMGQSAFSGLNKKWAATKWELSGKYRLNQYQTMLRSGEFGLGWDALVQRVGLDFLRQDGGAYIELIAPGKPDRPPTGAVVGLAHLDSLRCFPTGDPEYPVVYYNRLGKMHLLHRTRVLHMVDAPDGDDGNPGYGICALSRAISVVQQQIHMMRYITTALDEKPPPGMVVASNINEAQRNLAFARYNAEQQMDSHPDWGRTAWFYSIDPTQAAKLEMVSFSRPPENWSYREYTELHVNAWALALGVDVQELWQLTGGNIGSGAQSQVLHAKSQGRTFGSFLSRFERAINDVLPESLTFTFKLRDPFEELEEAQHAKLWGEFAMQVAPTMTLDERRRLLASQVQAYQDAVTDDAGEIAVLEDVDPETTGQVQQDVRPNPTRATTQPGRTPGTETAAAVTTPAAANAAPVQQKSLATTRDDFMGTFVALSKQVLDKELTAAQAGVVLRGHLAKYGLKAYLDGMAAGGVFETLDETDTANLALWNAEQRPFVTNFLDTLAGGGYSEAQLAQHAVLWANKSLDTAYQRGMNAANANGMYEWVYGKTEHCATCLALNGQAHRLKEYMRRGLMPRSDRLQCKGFNCQCQLVRTASQARGRWPK